jgi:arylsulfatase A-like enzyme
VRTLRCLALAIVLAWPWVLLDLGEAVVDAATKRPDIVVIHMDDLSPRAAGLWGDPARTPALARFPDRGVTFSHAVGSTPLCGPSRGNLLTGQYGHNNGITANDMRAYQPRTSLGARIRQTGYRTAYIGKFMNGLASQARTRAAMRRFADGWDRFSVIWQDNGRFYDYRYFTRSRTRHHGREATDHSSFVAAQEAVGFIRGTRRDRPLFMIVSLFDGHHPYQPMRKFVGHPACLGESWQGRAYDEEDVSDKPAYVRNIARRSSPSYDLSARCQSILTVDYVVQQVRSALARAGRLRDTLLVFTADNGWLMGEHRLVGKTHAYSTPVPLSMLWPARWGGSPRTIDEPVSNVDLAPTFCAIAGCRMLDPDGRSLLPLMHGTASHLARDFIYEEMLHGARDYRGGRTGRPGWYGIRTTRRYSDRLWVYTEHQRGLRTLGDRELYNVTADPHQLTNLAGQAQFGKVERRLRRMLHERVIKPDRVRFLRRLY